MRNIKAQRTRRLAAMLLIAVLPALSGCVPVLPALGAWSFDLAAFWIFLPLRSLAGLATSAFLNSL